MSSYDGPRYGQKLKTFAAERDHARMETAKLREELAVMTHRCALLANAVEALAALISGDAPARVPVQISIGGERPCSQRPDGRCTPSVPCAFCVDAPADPHARIDVVALDAASDKVLEQTGDRSRGEVLERPSVGPGASTPAGLTEVQELLAMLTTWKADHGE